MRMNFVRSAILFGIFSCALFLWLPQNTIIREGDAKGYYYSARLFAETNRLKKDKKKELLPVASGYPLLLGIIFKIFGDHAFLVVFLNIFFSILTLASMYRITCLEFGQEVAQLVLWMFPFHVGFLLYTQCALTEVTLAMLYTLFLEQVFFFLRFEKTYFLACAAIFLGVSLAIKPAAWIYGLFFSVMLLIAFFAQQIVFVQVITFVAMFFGFMLLYLFFNWGHFGVFGFPKIMARNINHLYLLKVYKAVYGVSEREALLALYKFSKHNHERWPLLAVMIKAHPFICIRIWLFNVMKTFGGFFSYHFALIANLKVKIGGSIFSFEGNVFTKGYRYLFGISDNLCLQALAVLELFSMLMRPVALLIILSKWFQENRYDTLLFVLSFVGYFLFITGPDGCARLRMMVEPLLFIIMLAGAYQVYKIIQRKTERKYEYECA